MASKVKGQSRISVTEQTQTRKRKPRGKPFENGNKANPNPFKSKEELGGALDPRINVGGRPKIMSDAYKEWLAMVQESDPQKRTNAQIGASAIGLEMMKGDVQAAKELRVATEGETLNLNGYTDDQLKEYIAGRLARLGIHVGTGGETEADSATSAEQSTGTPG